MQEYISHNKIINSKPYIDIALQSIVDGIEDELLVIDNNYRIRFANTTARRNLAETSESFRERPCYEVLHGRDKPCGAPLWECPLKETKTKETGLG